jgi:hypothetical protein
MKSIKLRCIVVAALVAAGCSESGPVPSAPSGPSVPLAALCSAALSLAETEFPADGGSTTGQVTASVAGCGWTISAPTWLTVTPSAGTSTTSVTVKAASSNGDSRTGTVVIDDTTIQVRQLASALGFSQARCHAPARAGASVPGPCSVTVISAGDPRSSGIRVTADLRVFGASATNDLVYIIAGQWDLDVRVPAGFPSGVVQIPFTAVDAQGRSATITVPLEVR